MRELRLLDSDAGKATLFATGPRINPQLAPQPGTGQFPLRHYGFGLVLDGLAKIPASTQAIAIASATSGGEGGSARPHSAATAR